MADPAKKEATYEDLEMEVVVRLVLGVRRVGSQGAYFLFTLDGA